MKDIKGLPVYKATIDDENDGMFIVSLVDFPAVEKDFLYFDEDKMPLSFSINNEEKRMVIGVVMSCDKPIYRISPNGMEYYIVYNADTIQKMAEKFLADGYHENVDTMHSTNLVEGVDMVQFFIKDTEKGINPVGFEDVKDGSLFAQYHILNDEIWNAVKDGTYKGFSLMGYFGIEPVMEEEDNDIKEIEEYINKIKKHIK